MQGCRAKRLVVCGAQWDLVLLEGEMQMEGGAGIKGCSENVASLLLKQRRHLTQITTQA